jgi:predicted nucleic acid-binding protein
VITLILLDTGPLGLVTNPKGGDEAERCKAWLRDIIATGADVIVPAIADYEPRRELVRGNKDEGLDRLDDLIDALGYLPVDHSDLFDAAWLWAEVRENTDPPRPIPPWTAIAFWRLNPSVPGGSTPTKRSNRPGASWS